MTRETEELLAYDSLWDSDLVLNEIPFPNRSPTQAPINTTIIINITFLLRYIILFLMVGLLVYLLMNFPYCITPILIKKKMILLKNLM